MNSVSGDILRRLIPAFVVGGVVLASLGATVPSLASNSDVGYGYANNSGVKGDGFHDHGKVCPNRPFPGHGNGVLRILASLGLSPETNLNVATHKTKANSVGTNAVSVSSAKDSTSTKKSHSHTNNGHHHGNQTADD